MSRLRVGVVSPEREIWAGEADMVIAKTLDGEIGIMPQHAPVLGVLSEGGVLRVRGAGEGGQDGDFVAAVHGGFISVANDEVHILAEQAELGSEVDVRATREELAKAEAAAGVEEDADVRAARARAKLRAAGEEV